MTVISVETEMGGVVGSPILSISPKLVGIAANPQYLTRLSRDSIGTG